MPIDLHRLAQDLLAITQGDLERLAPLQAKFDAKWLTAEKIRKQIDETLNRAEGPLTLTEIHQFLKRKFPEDGQVYTVNTREQAIQTNGLIEDSDWDIVYDAMRDRAITALHAGESMKDDALLRLGQRTDVVVTKLNIDGWHGRLTDRGLAALPSLPKLKDIQLCWQQNITDDSVANLAHCEQLEIVNLMGTNTGDAAIRALAGKPHLRKLSTGRKITNDGLARLQDIPRFTQKQSVPAEFGLMSFDAEPVHLLLDGPFNEQGVRHLKGLEGLSGLSFFWHCDNLTPSALEHLPPVSFLSIDGKLCDDKAMQHIGEKPGIRMLLAQGAVATAKGFQSLSRSQTIEFLWGRECECFDTEAFLAVSKMPALKGLAISCKNVDALDALADFPALAQFLPMDFTDDDFRHIGRCTNLESLWCMYCRETGDAATEHLTSLAKLKHYYAGKTRITDRSLEMLSRMPSLERIELWECAGVSEAGIRKLLELPNLKELSANGVDYLRR